MICFSCGSSRSVEVAEISSPYGLHKLGKLAPETWISVYCRDCGYKVTATSPRDDPDQAIRRARRVFQTGKKYGQEISWEELSRMYPEIRK